jgi:ABC-2 type transport system permease protein
MLASIKSEFRKLLSIRSTYVLTFLGFLLIGGLLDFYAQGYRATDELSSPQFLEITSLISVTFMAILTGIVALLMVTHEYRHNTIMYTLTSSNSRTKTLVAKAFVIAVYALVTGAFIAVVGPLLAWLGVSMQGASLVPQTVDFWDIAWRGLFYSVGNAMAAFVIAFIIRNQIGAIATYFVIASMVEELLTLVLKGNSKFLPFKALNEVVNFSAHSGEVVRNAAALSVGENALVFAGYMVVGLLATWILFLRRDAN